MTSDVERTKDQCQTKTLHMYFVMFLWRIAQISLTCNIPLWCCKVDNREQWAQILAFLSWCVRLRDLSLYIKELLYNKPLCVNKCVCGCASASVCMHVRVCVCVCVYIWECKACIYVHKCRCAHTTYAHTHIHTFKHKHQHIDIKFLHVTR